MKNKQNLHIHSTYADGKDQPEAMIQTAISRGYRTMPYPQMEFLRAFKDGGFGAVITSDCHDRNFIDCYFEEAEEMLRTAGFCSKWILTREGFREVAL